MSFRTATRCIAIIVVGLALLSVAPVWAQSTPAGADWRAALTCPSAQRQFDGVLYCTGVDETGAPIHVIVVDMAASGVAFEYVLPEGIKKNSNVLAECRDPNVPDSGGPAGGCATPDKPKLYPGLTLSEAVVRAQEVRPSSVLAAVINADYGATDATHGPEGLMVVRGERLDGAAHCDDDFNAVLRPWLGLGNAIGPNGVIPAQIATLDDDTAAAPEWMYTGIGGGPWLIQDGIVNGGSRNCQGVGRIDSPPPVVGCINGKKTGKPSSEQYDTNTCRAAPHTAAGLSANGRWLFLAMSTGNAHPDVLARFLAEKLGVWQALKFDGGGSSHLWFGGSTPLTVDAERKDRALTNHLAFYAAPGNGIGLPLDGQASEVVYYQVITQGERANFTFVLRNTGTLSWHPEDAIALRELMPAALWGDGLAFAIDHPVTPGGLAEITWQAPEGALTLHTLQLAQGDRTFGQPFVVLVVEMPAGMEDQRRELEAAIQAQIDEWRAQGEQQIADLQQQLEQAVRTWLQEQADNAAKAAQNWLEQMVTGLCAGIGLPITMVLVAGKLGYRRRKHH